MTVADVSGAYLHTEMDEVAVVKLEMADIFCELDKQYTSYISLGKNKRVLYLRLDKALYGCIRAALLWYELFSGTLQKLGCSINPYDMCTGTNVPSGGTSTTPSSRTRITTSSEGRSLTLKNILDQCPKSMGRSTVSSG